MKTERKFAYGDYLNWPQNERWEIIDGIAYNMSPAPTRRHQAVSGEMFRQIANYLKGKPCRVYDAPFDVRLPVAKEKDEDTETVVQPDIVVVCDKSKLDERGCKGAPTMVIEIVSPSSGIMDRKIKRDLYERSGVKEYWIVDEAAETAEVYKLNEQGQYGKPDAYGGIDVVKVGIFEDLEIQLKDVFSEEY